MCVRNAIFAQHMLTIYFMGVFASPPEAKLPVVVLQYIIIIALILSVCNTLFIAVFNSPPKFELLVHGKALKLSNIIRSALLDSFTIVLNFIYIMQYCLFYSYASRSNVTTTLQ
jgi:hypothetical protein